MSKKIVIILADGFEEIEAITPADIWMRLGFNMTLAGMESTAVKGAHGIVFDTGCKLSSVDPEAVDAVVLPGGMPGSLNLKNSDAVITFLKKANSAKSLICAICAAPIALGHAGLLDGRKFTCYPGFEEQIPEGEYTAEQAETDGTVVTGKGPGASFDFAAAVAIALGKTEAEIEDLFDGMMYND